MLSKLFTKLNEIRADRKIERHNKKLTKLLNKGLCIYQTTLWAFVRAEMKYDNCATLKAFIENEEDGDCEEDDEDL
jgi:hypothetical protein